MTEESGKIEGWMVVEMMGHQRLAGYVREKPLGGTVLLQVDVPEVTYQEQDYDYSAGRHIDLAPITIPGFTKFVSPNSLYAMTPCTEEAAKSEARRFKVQPISPARLPPAESPALAALPGPPEHEDDGSEFDDDGDEGL